MPSPSDFALSGRVAAGSQTESSVRLTCLSPDGRAVHSLLSRGSNVFIETHSLPLPETVDSQQYSEGRDNDDETTPSVVVTTQLPERIAAALRRYPAKELLCVDVEKAESSMTSLLLASPQQSSNPEVFVRLPMLCLYTDKDAYLLEMGYHHCPGATSSTTVQGTVLRVQEPYEELLMGGSSSTSSILRIRSAPQKYLGNTIMCPPGSMALLAHDGTTNEYRIVLYQPTSADSLGVSNDSMLITPLLYHIENMGDSAEAFTDFCFCQSEAFPLLSNLCLALLKGSGDIYICTPILFRGTVVSKATYTKTLHFLEGELQNCAADSARRRQYRIAKQYFIDAFPDTGNSQFLTVQQRSGAFDWENQLQGPVVTTMREAQHEVSVLSIAATIEPLGANELVGLVVGKLGWRLDFGVISPTTLIPRFSLETDSDGIILDDGIEQGATVCRLDLSGGNEGDIQWTKSCSVSLIRDPVMDTVVHYVTSTGVRSVSTNTVKVVSNKARDHAGVSGGLLSPPSRRKSLKPNTTTWSSLEIASSDSTHNRVVGAVVSGDMHLGHVLVSRLGNGSMNVANLTEVRQLQEMQAFVEDQDQPSDIVVVENTPALATIAEPLIKRIVHGIGGMTRVAGSSTPIADIQPDGLAAVLTIKEHCDKEVVLPLVELNEHTKMRRAELLISLQNQMKFAQKILKQLRELKERNATIQATAHTVRENATSLAQRGSSALQSSTDLLPSITQSEYDHFRELRKLDEKSAAWVNEFELLQTKCLDLCANVAESKPTEVADITLDLTTEEKAHLQALLKGCKTQMDMQKKRILKVEDQVDELASVAGIDRDEDSPAYGLRQ